MIVVVGLIHHEGDVELAKVGHARGRFGALLGLGEDGEQDRSENRNNRNDNKQLN